MHCNLPTTGTVRSKVQSIIIVVSIITFDFFMWIVQQRMSSRAAGWGLTEKQFSAFHALATISTTTSQVRSHLISPMQTRVTLVDMAAILCLLKMSSWWTIVTLTSEVGLLIAWLVVSYCFAWHHRIVVTHLGHQIFLMWLCYWQDAKIPKLTSLFLKLMASCCSTWHQFILRWSFSVNRTPTSNY